MNYYYVNTKNPYKIESTTYIDEFVDLLYEGSVEFISDIQRKELQLNDDYFEQIKKAISSYTDRVPLYDISFNHIYLIHRDNVYPRINIDNYRFVDKNFFDDLANLKNPTDTDKVKL